MNSLRNYYHRETDRYWIDADRLYSGYDDSYKCYVTVLDMETDSIDEIECVECDFTELFKTFCMICDRYCH